MSDDVVLLDIKDPGIGVLTLNRPERLNAWTGRMGAQYFQRLDECEADDSVKVIVVTGAGRGYCAGADMDNLAAAGEAQGGKAAGESPIASTESRGVADTIKISKPVIAAINGACAGIGLVQTLMCDLRFAAAGAKFTTAFARRGLIAEYGISWALPRLVGTANALDLLMSGRVFLAEEAKAMGMVNDVVPGDELLDHVLRYAADMAANASPTSMAVMKRQVYADANRTLEAATNEAISLMQASLKRPDFVEGVQSFLARRPPNFNPVVKDA